MIEVVWQAICLAACGEWRLLNGGFLRGGMSGVCNDGSVTYEWDEQASKEAADYPVSVLDADTLRRHCSQKAADLGPDGVSGHRVCFSLTAWDEPPGLVEGVPRTGWISRG